MLPARRWTVIGADVGVAVIGADAAVTGRGAGGVGGAAAVGAGAALVPVWCGWRLAADGA